MIVLRKRIENNGMDADKIRITKEQKGQDATRRQYNAGLASDYIGQSNNGSEPSDGRKVFIDDNGAAYDEAGISLSDRFQGFILWVHHL